MFKRCILFLFVFLFIIPQGISFRTWLNMWPELEAIAKCESNYNSQAIGDHGNSVGLFQIHLPAHPDVSKKEALDPFFSLAWAIDKFHKGEIGIWSCWKIVKSKGLYFDL